MGRNDQVVSGPVDVLAVLDAAAMGAYQRGHMTGDRHFPGVREYEQARAAVAELIAERDALRSVVLAAVKVNALSIQSEAHKELREALKAAGACVCSAADMPFGRCCNAARAGGA